MGARHVIYTHFEPSFLVASYEGVVDFARYHLINLHFEPSFLELHGIV